MTLGVISIRINAGNNTVIQDDFFVQAIQAVPVIGPLYTAEGTPVTVDQLIGPVAPSVIEIQGNATIGAANNFAILPISVPSGGATITVESGLPIGFIFHPSDILGTLSSTNKVTVQFTNGETAAGLPTAALDQPYADAVIEKVGTAQWSVK
jgi:hypothetical protein